MIQVKKMHCSACKKETEHRLTTQDGVTQTWVCPCGKQLVWKREKTTKGGAK